MTDLDPGVVDAAAPPSDSKDSGDAARNGGRRPRLSEKGRKTRRTIIEWTILIGSALLIAILIKTFLFQAFYIPSESMKPTLNVGDRVLVNKVSYHLHDVNRGDIVVFETPPKAKDANGEIKDLVKRVIGLPGETFSAHGGAVFINGRPLKESYLQKGVETCAPGRARTDHAPNTVLCGAFWLKSMNTRAPRSSFHHAAVIRSGRRRSSSRAIATAAARTSYDVHRGSSRA